MFEFFGYRGELLFLLKVLSSVMGKKVLIVLIVCLLVRLLLSSFLTARLFAYCTFIKAEPTNEWVYVPLHNSQSHLLFPNFSLYLVTIFQKLTSPFDQSNPSKHSIGTNKCFSHIRFRLPRPNRHIHHLSNQQR